MANTATTQNTGTKVVTGTVRFSYVQVFEPKSTNGGEPKYSMQLIIPKKDKKTVTALMAAIEAAKAAGKAKWGGKIPANIKTPLRDGDVEKEGEDLYEGCYFMNCSSSKKPLIVDQNAQDIIDSTEVYSGCWGKASINLYPFDVNGNRGIAAGLNGLQKIKDDVNLAGGDARNDFSAVKDEEEGFLG